MKRYSISPGKYILKVQWNAIPHMAECLRLTIGNVGKDGEIQLSYIVGGNVKTV